MDERTAELEFLPAALEIAQTPPLPMSRWILWSIMAFFTSALTWACLGEMNIVGVAHGKIVPSGRVKVVQPLDTGVVRAIRVAEGDRVAAGALLIELDDTKARADLDRLRQEYGALARDRQRLEALLARLHRSTSGPSPARASHPAAMTPAQAMLAARIHNEFTAYAAERQTINEDIKRNRAERLAVEQRIAQLGATLPLLGERVDALAKLEKKSLAPRASWLELEEQRIEQTREQDVLRAQLAIADAAHDNLSERRTMLLAQTEADWLAQLADVDNRIAGYQQELRKADTRLREHRLTAPVAGTVQQLSVNTVGGVVAPAEKLMLIVPDEGALHVEAWVPNKDIGFVHDGQAAAIKIETFPFTKYGLVEGAITTVSNDAIADENLGLVYLAQVEMASTTMWVKDKLVNLSPGMAVTVEVDMGKRRLIEFLLTPLLRYQNEALKER